MEPMRNVIDSDLDTNPVQPPGLGALGKVRQELDRTPHLWVMVALVYSYFAMFALVVVLAAVHA